jgi:aspartate/methionine/tyrosine aminotransferase
MSHFRPFEYMAWAKSVRPGARYAMHVSGLSAPPPHVPLCLPEEETWTASPGPLAEQLSVRLRDYLGCPAGDVLITGGDSEAIFVALAAHVQRGAPVIVERPAYAAMERCVEFLGGTPVLLDRAHQDGWRLDPEHLSALLHRTGARVVAITDPHNPTGVSSDPDTRCAVIECVERHGALLVVDEVFAPFRGPDRPPAWSAASDRVLSLGSLTKGWGLSALRIGWAVGAADAVAPCRQVFDLLGVNPPSVTLALAAEALRNATERDRHAHQASRQVHDAFAGAGWHTDAITDGIIGFRRLPDGRSSETVVQALRDLDGVQAVPGHFFGRDEYIRVGFDPAITDGITGCRLIVERLAGLRGDVGTATEP